MMPPGPSWASRLVARTRSLWRGLSRRAEVEAEMDEEFRHHVELRAEDLVRRGLPPDEAARRARLEFGHVEAHKERARASRGLRPFDRIGLSWLDVKLGLRMLAKYPGLSLVSVVGMSVAIAIGAGGFGFIHGLVGVGLPLEEGDRIVTLRDARVGGAGDAEWNGFDDLRWWRERLESVQDLSAFVEDQQALAVQGGDVAVVPLARMTASAFRVARVAPVLGRTLLEEDEREGATPVVVIGQEEWRRRFGEDPDILGRQVRLGTTLHTVVGVMPEAFAFPVAHRYWAPLRTDPRTYPRGLAPDLTMFGRLADDATLEQARAEVETIGSGMPEAGARPAELHRPGVLPYTDAYLGIGSPQVAWLIRSLQYVLGLFLVVVAVNVAVLVYARTAARMGEITVRTALGASRRRVLTQLFAEAVVLSLLAAVAGLGIASLGFRWFDRLVSRGNGIGLPYWVDLGLSPGLIAYTGGLVLLAGVIVGVLPGIKATGQAIQSGLQRLHSGGYALRLGRTWTALIVAQVGIAVAVLPYAIYMLGPSITRGLAEADYAVEEFLRVPLSIDGAAEAGTPNPAAVEQAGVRARFRESSTELLRRLRVEPAVAGVTYARRFPGRENDARVEVEGTGTRAAVWLNQVDPELFRVFDIPVLVGRALVESDAEGASNAVIVDRVLAELVLGGGNVLGRRIRLLSGSDYGPDEPGPWLEVVGVVPMFTVPPGFQPDAPKLYQPLALAEATPGAVQLAIRTRRETPPVAFMGRLRELTASVDPRLRLDGLETATEAERERREGLLFVGLVTLAVTASVLLLSAAGIYAMVSFTVASRWREIGIRSALGAAPRRVLAGIFRRAGAQLGAGVLGGLLVAESVIRIGGESFLEEETMLLLPTVVVVVAAIGVAAALGPARRALAIQPTEALRDE